jgi:hypothetical protein
MNDQLPAPNFDRKRYERPNHNWICGHTCDGRPCRLGPTSGGDCRTSAECAPVLEKVAGETKGRWKCTRTHKSGDKLGLPDPCTDGPGPDGSCGCPIVRCSPRRSLRNLRGRLTWLVVAGTFALLLIAVAGPWRWNFISPGTLSNPHRSAGFDVLSRERFGQPGCAGCHQAAEAGVGQWLLAAYHSDPGLTQFARLAQANTREETRMDAQNCVACHTGYDRHQPDVVHAHSCSACHLEHQGERMALPTDEGCAHCHADGNLLKTFAAKAVNLASADFDPPLSAGAVAFHTERPAQGRVTPFRSFWEGHPNFGVLTTGKPDPNTLKFPHQTHLGNTVTLGGRPLDCADCHQPDATGAYMNRISFEQHCQSCHSLQFDPFNPELTLPHGSVEAVQALVRSLPVQYTDLGRRKGLRSADDLAEFSRQAQARIRQTLGSGDQLLQQTLFNPDPRRVDPKLSSERRAQLAGCAYCHEVKPHAQQLAVVTPPTIPDRWLVGGRFTHARHSPPYLNCVDCHASVRTSTTAADINLPAKESCVRCHGPVGKVAASCATCHSYHLFRNAGPAAGTATATPKTATPAR